MNISCDPSFTPSFGNKIEQLVCGTKVVFFRGYFACAVDLAVGTRRFLILVLFASFCSTQSTQRAAIVNVLTKVEVGEAVMFY